ncbi:hypothetical protein Tco_0921026 [Tanacetum coccineum]
MSQSIPEQLNVDRREFADAVNALTKFVFLKYQLEIPPKKISTQSKPFFIKFESYKPQSLHHESEYSRTAECSGAGIFSSAIVSVKEYQQRSVHLIL